MNEAKLHELVGTVLQDLGGAFSIPLVRIGESLGLYQQLHAMGPSTPELFAEKIGLNERYIREWLAGQAASGYITYEPSTGAFSLTPEQAFVFADSDSPFYMAPAFEAAYAFGNNKDEVEKAFRTGEGFAWTNMGGCLTCATAKFFRPGYQNHLVKEWLPSLDGVVEKLERGAKVADIGCGHGLSTVFMAEAFPKSQFHGFDFDDGSIQAAKGHAKEHGLSNVAFDTSTAKDAQGEYDLVCFFDCLHDMGDPAGAMRHAKEILAPGGKCMIVEPMAGDSVEENINPVGRLYYAASTVVCVPTSRAQEVGTALGAQAGEKRLTEVVKEGGFSSVRRAAETPFNIILEAKP